jgi:hypothetical protein
MTNYADLAAQVAKQFRKDEARKQKILARSPHLAYALDAEEVARMSSRELAARELKELGIPIGKDADPEEMLNMYHLGRQHAMGRDSGIIGGFAGIKGGREAAQRLIGGEGEGGGSASDSADSGSLADKLAKHYGI